MGLYVRGNRYYFKKQLEGKVYYKALKLKKGQEKLLSARIEQIEEEIIAEHFGIPYQQNKQISFIDYCEKYLESKKHKKSWDADKSRLMIIAEFWGDLKLDRIEKSHIEKLEKYLFSRKIQPSTGNRYFETLRHFFNLAIEEGYIKKRENPCRFYEPFQEEKKSRDLTIDEIKKVLIVAKNIQEERKTYVQAIIYDLILFGFLTAMRPKEIFHLRKSYIRDDIIFYPVSKVKRRRRGKSSKKIEPRIICLNKIAQAIINKQKSQDDYVFHLKRRHSSVVRKTVAKIRKLTGIEDFNFYQLRHTTSEMITKHVGLVSAQLLLGHSDLKTTQKFYTHPKINEQRKGVAKIEELYSDLLSLTN